MNYKSPFKTLATIIFCIILAIILREIVRAESAENSTKIYEAIPEYHFEDITQKTVSYLPSTERKIETYTITAYCPCQICCGEWSDGFTYSGDLAHEGVTIAADLTKLPLGTKVWIEGIGERVVQDKGGAIKGNRIDLFFYHHSDALAFGVQQLEVTVVD